MVYPVGQTKEEFTSKWYSAQGYGNPTAYGFHEGVDLNLKTGGATDLGQPIFAIAAGEVVHCVTHAGGFGKHVVIKHYNPECWSLYAHCDLLGVKVGDAIIERQKIATLGSTGNSKSPHLHFAVMTKWAGSFEAVANTKEELQFWSDPITFIDNYNLSITDNMITPQTILEVDGVKKEWQSWQSDIRLVPKMAVDLENANKKISDLEASHESLTQKLDKLSSQVAESQKQIAIITQDNQLLTEENQRFQEVDDDRKAWKSRYEEALKTQINKYSSWQLIQIGLSQIIKNIIQKWLKKLTTLLSKK